MLPPRRRRRRSRREGAEAKPAPHAPPRLVLPRSLSDRRGTERESGGGVAMSFRTEAVAFRSSILSVARLGFSSKMPASIGFVWGNPIKNRFCY